MKVAVLSITQCVPNHDSRVYREATTLHEAGHDVFIVGSANTESEAIPSNYDGIRVERIYINWKDSVNRVKPPWLRVPIRIVRPFMFPFLINYASVLDYSYKAYQLLRQYKPDIVHAHDLPAMPLAVFCKRQFGSSVIYDNHELWLDRNTAVPLRFIWKASESILERMVMKKADATLTVNDSLSSILEQRYHIKPITILNYPISPQSPFTTLHYWNDIPADKKILLYIGLITPNRGVEQVIRAMAYLSDHVLVMMGYYLDADYPLRIQALVESEGVSGRVKFMGAVPYNHVTSYAQSADVGIMLIKASCTSYQFCFPNKLLESVSAGIPVVVNKATTDVANFVEKYSIGIAVDPDDALEVAKAVKDATEYPVYRLNAKMLSRQISWESQGAKLLSIYNELDSKRIVK